MFDSHKTLNRTNNTVNEAPANIYSVLNKELDRLHQWINDPGMQKNKDNVHTLWKRIVEIQDVLIECAKKGADEDLKAKVEDLRKHAAEQILIGENAK